MLISSTASRSLQTRIDVVGGIVRLGGSGGKAGAPHECWSASLGQSGRHHWVCVVLRVVGRLLGGHARRLRLIVEQLVMVLRSAAVGPAWDCLIWLRLLTSIHGIWIVVLRVVAGRPLTLWLLLLLLLREVAAIVLRVLAPILVLSHLDQAVPLL